MEINRNRKDSVLQISQTNYCGKVLKKYNLDGAKPVTTPLAHHFKLSASNAPKEDELEHLAFMKKVPYSQAVGSLMYLMVSTRPDLTYATSLVSRYMALPGKRHWEAVKWVLRYLKGAKEASLHYRRNDQALNEVFGYVDSDFAGDLDKRRSLSGYFFLLGKNLLSWKATLQSVVALSTTEAELIALTEAVKEGIWLKGLLQDFGLQQPKVKIYCNNQSTIFLTKNPQFNSRTKNIVIKYHFIREQIERGEVEVMKVHTTDNATDILMKPLSQTKVQRCLDLVGFHLPEKG